MAGQTGGAIRLSLIFLILFASRQKVWQTSLGKQKKREELKKILYWLEERRNTTDNGGLPSSFIHVAIAAGQDPGRVETISLLIPVLMEPPY